MNKGYIYLILSIILGCITNVMAKISNGLTKVIPSTIGGNFNFVCILLFFAKFKNYINEYYIYNLFCIFNFIYYICWCVFL